MPGPGLSTTPPGACHELCEGKHFGEQIGQQHVPFEFQTAHAQYRTIFDCVVYNKAI